MGSVGTAMSSPQMTLLVTVTGRDRPGVTSRLFSGLAGHELSVLDVSGADPTSLRAALARESAEQGVDVAVQRGGLHRRAMRLVVMDVDSTLVDGEAIDLLAVRAGCAAKVAELTAATMRGELDFATALRERVGMGRGGFTQFTDVLAADLGLDYAAAKTLEIVSGKLTGQVTGAVIDRAGKARALREFAASRGVPLSQTVAVGDGANDLDMIAAAGLGTAFTAKPPISDASDASVSVRHRDAILPP